MPRPIRGLTLLELVLALATSTVILGLLMVAYFAGIRAFTQEIDQFDMFWEGEQAVDRLVSEVRESLDITSLENTVISFWWRDINGNTSMEADEIVTYSRSGDYLVRSNGGSSQPLARNVALFNLDFDDPIDPSLIRIKLVLAKNGSITTIESKVAPRL